MGFETRACAGAHPAQSKNSAGSAVSERLLKLVVQAIEAGGGALGFDRFMEIVLYTPGLGYYMAGQTRFGELGDFITAPELSPLFAQCLARQVAEVSADLANPVVLEIGAGSGRLASDLLDELQALDALPAGYLILEPSADLRAQQLACLQRSPCRARWIERLSDAPREAIVIANEVLDAMPVSRFKIAADGSVQDGGWSGVPLADCGAAR